MAYEPRGVNRLGTVRGFVGNMASGKTSRLIGLAYEPSKQFGGLLFIQPKEASRQSSDRIQSRIFATYEGAVAVSTPKEIIEKVKERPVKYVFLEEIQFFGQTPEMLSEFQEAVRWLRANGYHICWSGLPLDFRGEPFEGVAWMMALSDTLEQLQVECAVCGMKPAPLPQRLRYGHPVPKSDPRFVADTADRKETEGISYEPRCVEHHVVPEEPNEHLKAILDALHGQPDNGPRPVPPVQPMNGMNP